MEDKENPEKNGEVSSSEETKKETKVDIEHNETEKETSVVIELNVGAGTSKTEDLPGSVPSPRLFRTGISKSEHSIPRLITRQDVANALKLTSISFGTTKNQTGFNMKSVKIPALDPNDKEDESKFESATTVDVRKFMASCFKFNKEAPADSSLPEMSVSNMVNERTEVPTEGIHLPNLASSSCAQTDETIVPKVNEVIVTGVAPAMETKVSIVGNDTKKIPKSESDLGLAKRDSLSSIGSNVCRICMTRGRERLISPCNCKGSLANVHLSCLERWLNQVGRNHCELCGFSYPAIRTPRYTVLQALRLWFGNPRNRSHLQSDCLIFWLLSTVTAGLLAVCIVGTQYFVIEGTKFGKGAAMQRKEEGISHRITETAMDFFMGIVLCGYSVTVYLLWKDHYVMWNRWRRANVNIRLLITPDTEPVPFLPRTRCYVI